MKTVPEKKNESLSHPRADFYVIFPFHIKDPNAFEDGLKASGIWERKTDCTKQTLKNIINSYLGEDEPSEFPIIPGQAFTGHIGKSPNPVFSSFTGKVTFKNAKGEFCFLKEDGSVRSFWPGFDVDLHIAPNRHSGVAFFQLSTGSCSLQEAVNINYTIQKCDPDQVPILCSFRDEAWIPIDGRKTLKELFLGLLPDAVSPENAARFLMASNVMVDTSTKPDTSALEDALTRLGMVKGWSYKIDDFEKKRCEHLFDNIWTYASHEGFATIALTPDIQKEKFLNDFHGRFPKSYLPIYLTTVLAELTYKSAIKHLNTISVSPDEQDRIRETRIMLMFEPSPYTHLIRLMNSIKEVWHFEEKYQVITSSINARIASIEAERLKIERKNQELALQRKSEAEVARRAREEEKQREREKQDRHDRTINLLLGFIGIGQVVFAILQLLGADYVMGLSVANSRGLSIASIVMLAVFTALIIILLVRLFIDKKR